jgi:hypothetical protein
MPLNESSLVSVHCRDHLKAERQNVPFPPVTVRSFMSPRSLLGGWAEQKKENFRGRIKPRRPQGKGPLPGSMRAFRGNAFTHIQIASMRGFVATDFPTIGRLSQEKRAELKN